MTCLTVSTLLSGCQHLSQGPSYVRREKDPVECKAIAKGDNLHEAVIKMRPDGGCDVRGWRS